MQNVLLIVIDTLRADHLSCYDYPYPTSPNVDRVAARGVRFASCFGDTNCTDPNFTSILTGKYLLTHDVIAYAGQHTLSPELPTLAEILKKIGYATLAADNLILHKPWFDRGFDDYRLTCAREEHAAATPAPRINEQAIPLLDDYAKRRTHEPFFMFVHYWDPHSLYRPPERYQRFYPAGKGPKDPGNHGLDDWRAGNFESGYRRYPGVTDPDYITSLYDGEICHSDDYIGQLLECLDALKLTDDTLVIITADHGEIMNETTRQFYGSPLWWTHLDMVDGTLHVPLILMHPSLPQGMALDPLIQQCDIGATILDFIGHSDLIQEYKIEGQSLLPLIRGDNWPKREGIFLSEDTYQCKRAWRTPEWKFVLRTDLLEATPRRELYHLTKDRFERRNVADLLPDIAAGFEATLEEWVSRHLAKWNKPDPRTIQMTPADGLRVKEGMRRALLQGLDDVDTD